MENYSKPNYEEIHLNKIKFSKQNSEQELKVPSANVFLFFVNSPSTEISSLRAMNIRKPTKRQK